MKKSIPSLLLFALIISCQASRQTSSTRNDPYLVIPGRMAEGFILGEKITSYDEYKRIDTGSTPSSLRTILKNEKLPRIEYDHILYLGNRHALFINGNAVSCIAGLNPRNHVTPDAVRLSDGVDNFVINYGNSGLELLRDSDHRVYIYRKLGIIIFDDNADDRIDMYLIFAPEK